MSRQQHRGLRDLLKKTIRNLRGVLVFTACTVSTIFWVLPLMVLALVKFLIPIKSVRELMTRWIMGIGEIWISGNAVFFGLANSTQWVVRGADDLSIHNWYLLICNHQTWVDIVVLQTVLNRRVPFLKFFIKQELIWFPFLGIAWWAMDMPFMKRYSKSYLAKNPHKKGRDLEATRKSCEKFRGSPTSVINFVEGTRFTPAKQQARSVEFRNLLVPRAGGVALVLKSMGDMFDTILDVTIVYPTMVPQFWAMCCGEFDHVIVDIQQRPIESWMIDGDYAEDRNFRRNFHQQLTTMWNEKDDQIDALNTEYTAQSGNR